MQLMVDANIQCVFIGIESPNEESLRETKKFQNVRRGPSMVERVHTVQDAGMDVWCGMIVGFDHDDAGHLRGPAGVYSQARILHAMIGMLSAIPKTPLYDRLLAEGRLDQDDEPEFGTNVIPLGMTREELRDGCRPDAGIVRASRISTASKTSFARAGSISRGLAMPTGAYIHGLSGSPSQSMRCERPSCLSG